MTEWWVTSPKLEEGSLGCVLQDVVEGWVSVVVVGLFTNHFSLLLGLLPDLIGMFVFFPCVFPSIIPRSPGDSHHQGRGGHLSHGKGCAVVWRWKTCCLLGTEENWGCGSALEGLRNRCFRGQRDGSAVKRMCGSCRGARFGSRYPHSGSNYSSRELNSSSGL